MQAEALATAIAEQFGASLKVLPAPVGELACEVPADQLLSVAKRLRDDPALRFEMLIDVAGLDLLGYGNVEWQTDRATASGFSRGVDRNEALDSTAAPHDLRRFAVVYQLLSVTLNHRLRLRCYCELGDDSGGDPMVDSVTGIWASADWFEREAYDLFGIVFRNHPDLRRILTDYGFIGHPFRKDFPLIGNLEVRYDATLKRVVYEPVTIEERILVPRVIRHDNRYEAALKNTPPATGAK